MGSMIGTSQRVGFGDSMVGKSSARFRAGYTPRSMIGMSQRVGVGTRRSARAPWRRDAWF